MRTPNRLNDEQVHRYWTDGYLVVPDLLTEAEAGAFLAHEEQHRQERSFGLHGHMVDPQYRALATNPGIVGRAGQLLGGRPCIVQTMFLDKAHAGYKGIALHQDSHYLPNEPNTLMACWLALTDTDRENGGLCVVPGSHRLGLRSAHKARNEAEHAVWENEHLMRDREGREWKQTMVSFDIDDLDPASIVYLAVPRGSGVFFTGLTIHGSFASRAADRRRAAFAVHYVREDTWVLRQDVQTTMPADGAAETAP